MASSSIREVTTSATLEEKKKLRKEFNYFDMIFYTISALVGLDTLGARGDTSLNIAHALDFSTYRSLVKEQRLKIQDAMELMIGFVSMVVG